MTSCTTQAKIVELSAINMGATAWSWKKVTHRDPGPALNSEAPGSGWLPHVQFLFHSLMTLLSLVHWLPGPRRTGDFVVGWKKETYAVIVHYNFVYKVRATISGS